MSKKDRRTQLYRTRLKHEHWRRKNLLSFGFTPAEVANMCRLQTAVERRRCDEVNFEFDTARLCNISEIDVFLGAFWPDKEGAIAALNKFRRDVRTCPEHVLTYLRERVAAYHVQQAESALKR